MEVAIAIITTAEKSEESRIPISFPIVARIRATSPRGTIPAPIAKRGSPFFAPNPLISLPATATTVNAVAS